MRRRFAAVSLLLVVFLVLTNVVAYGQDRNWRRALEQALVASYPVTKFSFINAAVTSEGQVFVIQQDGVLSQNASDASIRPLIIKNGKARQDTGFIAGLSDSVSGRARSDAGTFKKGSKVYIANVDIPSNNRVLIAFSAVDYSDFVAEGNSRRTRLKGALLFEFDGDQLSRMTATEVKSIVEPWLVSEAAVSGPKSIRLGQTISEVEATFGQPRTRIELGPRMIYTYPDIKVTFTDGKVSDVQ